ncbi:MAG: tetratricopeptide repeat protein, partial [Pseudomonadota bacterium]
MKSRNISLLAACVFFGLTLTAGAPTAAIETTPVQPLDPAITFCLEIDGELPDWWIHLGRSDYTARSKSADTVEVASLSRELRPVIGNAEAHYNRGIDLLNTGEFGLAIEAFDNAVKLNPRDPLNYEARGYTHALNGDRLLALIDYESAITLDPCYAEAYFDRAILYRTWGKLELALHDLNRLIRLTPEDPAAWNSRGSLHRQMKVFDLALI